MESLQSSTACFFLVRRRPAFAICKDLLTRLAAIPSVLLNRLSSIRIRLAEKLFLTGGCICSNYDDAVRANFYTDLGRVLNEMVKADKPFVFGNYNVRLRNDDRPRWSCVIGLTVAETFFKNGPGDH